MKGLHKLILTHFEAHQRAKWDDPKARDMLAKLLVKKIKEHLQGLDWNVSVLVNDFLGDDGEPTTADKYNKEYLNGLYGLGEEDVANQYGDDDYPTNLLDDESV